MGFFDRFKSKPESSAVADGSAASDRSAARLGKVAGDKHAQNYDRIEAIDALVKLGTATSAGMLLKRFTFHIDPSITDQDEKEAAMRGVLAAGEAALEPIRAFSERAESLAWPLKILRELLPAERYQAEVLALLERFDTEYTRNTDPKQQLIAELEHLISDSARQAAERFLDDVSDDIRWSAVVATLAQGDPASAPALARVLADEESMRVRTRIAEGLAARGWEVAADLHESTRRALPSGFALGDDGKVRRR